MIDDNIKRIGIVIIAAAVAAYVLMAIFFPKHTHRTHNLPEEISVEVERENTEEASNLVNIFFIASNNKGEEVYRAVKRDYNDSQGSKLSFVIKQLILGPTEYEKQNGVYSEIPTSTKLLGVTEAYDKYIINLSSDFEYGGGADSLYKRVYQLIKTVLINSDLPVYLEINGRQVNMLGGEGLILKQPLSGESLSE